MVTSRPFRVLSLCSGVGGLDRGVSLAVSHARTVCYVEGEAYAVAVLAARMAGKTLDAAPCWDNVRSFDGQPWCGRVDCVVGGYPCQPFSVAGKRKAEDDPRHLWPAIARILRECQPEWVFFENVGNHLSLGFETVGNDLQGLGYKVAAGLFTAEEVGAPHKRERLFILGRRSPEQGGTELDDPGHDGWGSSERGDEQEGTSLHSSSGGCLPVGLADSGEQRLEGYSTVGTEAGTVGRGGRAEIPLWPPKPSDRAGWGRVLKYRPELAPAVGNSDDTGCKRTPLHLPLWEPLSTVPDPSGAVSGLATAEEKVKPAVRGVVDGLVRELDAGRNRVDRLRACGNGVVPVCAAYAFSVLADALELEE